MVPFVWEASGSPYPGECRVPECIAEECWLGPDNP